MPQMRVKDLIAILQTVDPELPIHKHRGGGEFPAVDIDMAGHWTNYATLMQHKTEKSFFGLAKDAVWKNARKRFGKPFKAVVFW